MATNSGGTTIPGSNDGSSSHDNDIASNISSNESPLLNLPLELQIEILNHLSVEELLNARLICKDVAAAIQSMKFCIRIWPKWSTPPEGGRGIGIVVDFIRLGSKPFQLQLPREGDDTWTTRHVDEVIGQLPTTWLKLASDVALWSGEMCNTCHPTGILDQLHERLKAARSEDPEEDEAATPKVVKLHLIRDPEYDYEEMLPISFFTNKTNATIAGLQPEMKLATLQLDQMFEPDDDDNSAMRQVLDYFAGTEAITKLVLHSVGQGIANPLEFVYCKSGDNQSVRFPNLTALALTLCRDLDEVVFPTDWNILTRFAKLTHLELVGDREVEFVLPLWNSADKLAAVRSLSLCNVQLPAELNFLKSMPGLQKLRVGRETDSPALTNNNISQVCEMMRKGHLPNLRTATFEFNFTDRQSCLGRLQSVLEAVSERKCPNLEHLTWVTKGNANGFALATDPAKDVRSVFWRLGPYRLEKTRLRLELVPHNLVDESRFGLLVDDSIGLIDDSVTSGNLSGEIFSLTASVQCAGLKQLKITTMFRNAQPNWQQTVTQFNASQTAFTATIKQRDINDVDAAKEPTPVLWIVCKPAYPRNELLIIKRAAPVHAADIA